MLLVAGGGLFFSVAYYIRCATAFLEHIKAHQALMDIGPWSVWLDRPVWQLNSLIFCGIPTASAASDPRYIQLRTDARWAAAICMTFMVLAIFAIAAISNPNPFE
jgi:hypothetical protein